MNRVAALLLPLWVLAGAAVAGGLVSCTEINAAAGHVASLEFDTLPAPAVVAGDTLRDSLGRAAPLRAVAFNGAGNVIADPAIQYIALDSGVTITAGHYLVAQRRSGSVRLIANATSIQSAVRTLLVARQPDSVVVTGKLRDTLKYVLPDNVSSNSTAGLSVKVVTRDTSGGITATQGWLVSYQAFFGGKAIAPGDTSVAFLLSDGAQRSSLDTTSSDGTASRRVRVRPIGITQSATDSVIVIATVRYRGSPVRGSPVRFVILLRPK
jgi:hypothetical protein